MSDSGQARGFRPYALLGVGALGAGIFWAALAGAGVASADRGSDRNANNSTAASAPASASASASASTVTKRPESRRPARSIIRPTATAIAGASTSFQILTFTGGPQTWVPPTGVNEANFTVGGAVGGSGYFGGGGFSAPISATLDVSAPDTTLNIVVGGTGGSTVEFQKPGGAGGYNGGGPGGSGSNNSTGGGGGGGATTVSFSGSNGPVLVGGGGGGGGGSSTSAGGQGGTGGVGPSSNGVWAGGNGSSTSADNAGAGGTGSTQSDGIGAGGGDAETLSGNAGGGGAGGGWRGGSGGQAGQADIGPFTPAGPGGGGGAGSSYADPQLTTNVSVGSAQGFTGVTIQWVNILTTSLSTLRAGRPTSQELQAVYGTYVADYGLIWAVTGGALPSGLSLNPLGQLTGTPTKSQAYNFQVTVVEGENLASSVWTYSGAVCKRRCPKS